MDQPWTNRFMSAVRATAVFIVLAGGIPAAQAQSLFRREVKMAVNADNQPDPNANLRGSSLLFVEPPKPREFQKHGQITIIIDETSKATSDQTLDAKKDYNTSAGVTDFPSLAHLLELQLENGDSARGAALGVTSKNKFKGTGKYERSDKFNARITAEIIDVKPNGVLVLEARKSIAKDKEVQVLVLSGRCRGEDVTTANTVLSSQLAELTVAQQNEGQVKDTSTKGLIPRVLDTIFNF